MKKQRKGYKATPEMEAAFKTSPVAYIEAWWKSHSTEEERNAAEERGATPSGAYAFVESVARKKNCKCFPDLLVYDLVGMFMRNGADGDEFISQEELDERNRKAELAEEERKIAKARAEEHESNRLAAMSEEERAEELRVKEERKKKAAESEEKRKIADEARAARIAKIERARAIAKEIKDRQMTFNF